MYLQNEYYYELFTNQKNNLPKFQENYNSIISNCDYILDKIKENYRLFENDSTDFDMMLECFENPFICNETLEKIKNRFYFITSADLTKSVLFTPFVPKYNPEEEDEFGQYYDE